MITSVISSAARLSLAPARLAGRMAGSLLSGLRGDTAEDSHPAPSSTRTRTASRTRAKAQRKRAASGTRAKAQPTRTPRGKRPDDVTIARKVESTIFSGVDVDEGKVDVKVAKGVVRLRGEVRTPDLIRELETRAGRLTEVRRVENLLQLPKPPAPSRSAMPTPQSERSRPATRPDDRAVMVSETSGEVPAPPSALGTRNFAAPGEGHGPTHAGGASGVAESVDESPAGDESVERESPDVPTLDKDQAHPEEAASHDRAAKAEAESPELRERDLEATRKDPDVVEDEVAERYDREHGTVRLNEDTGPGQGG